MKQTAFLRCFPTQERFSGLNT